MYSGPNGGRPMRFLLVDMNNQCILNVMLDNDLDFRAKYGEIQDRKLGSR
jgi:hypothetical protein